MKFAFIIILGLFSKAVLSECHIVHESIDFHQDVLSVVVNKNIEIQSKYNFIDDFDNNLETKSTWQAYADITDYLIELIKQNKCSEGEVVSEIFFSGSNPFVWFEINVTKASRLKFLEDVNAKYKSHLQ